MTDSAGRIVSPTTIADALVGPASALDAVAVFVVVPAGAAAL
jgi:hypothetical protein